MGPAAPLRRARSTNLGLHAGSFVVRNDILLELGVEGILLTKLVQEGGMSTCEILVVALHGGIVSMVSNDLNSNDGRSEVLLEGDGRSPKVAGHLSLAQRRLSRLEQLPDGLILINVSRVGEDVVDMRN